MLLPGTISLKTCLIFAVLVTFFVLCETAENHKLNIRFGFDLKQGSDGAPSLHIRDFEEPSVNRRADDESSDSEKRPKPKASSSDSESEEPIKKESSKEKDKGPKSDASDGSDSSEDNGSDDNDKIRSTRALKAEDFEPEGDENSRIHSKFEKHHSEESDGSSRRRRSIGASIMEKIMQFAF